MRGGGESSRPRSRVAYGQPAYSRARDRGRTGVWGIGSSHPTACLGLCGDIARSAPGIAPLVHPSEISGGAVSLEWLGGSSDLAIHHPPSPDPPEPFPSPRWDVILYCSSLSGLSWPLSSSTASTALSLPLRRRATRVCPLVARHSSGSAPIPPLHAVKGELRHFFPRLILGIRW